MQDACQLKTRACATIYCRSANHCRCGGKSLPLHSPARRANWPNSLTLGGNLSLAWQLH